jgi:hypothetical protein
MICSYNNFKNGIQIQKRSCKSSLISTSLLPLDTRRKATYHLRIYRQKHQTKACVERRLQTNYHEQKIKDGVEHTAIQTNDTDC